MHDRRLQRRRKTDRHSLRAFFRSIALASKRLSLVWPGVDHVCRLSYSRLDARDRIKLARCTCCDAARRLGWPMATARPDASELDDMRAIGAQSNAEGAVESHRPLQYAPPPRRQNKHKPIALAREAAQFGGSTRPHASEEDQSAAALQRRTFASAAKRIFVPRRDLHLKSATANTTGEAHYSEIVERIKKTTLPKVWTMAQSSTSPAVSAPGHAAFIFMPPLAHTGGDIGKWFMRNSYPCHAFSHCGEMLSPSGGWGTTMAGEPGP